MDLQQWQANGWLKPHKTDAQEIGNLLAMIERDIRDATGTNISADWHFGIAYNAALKLCTLLLFANGYRPENNLAHYRTILSLPHTLGQAWQQESIFLNTCRIKRNILEYDCSGHTTEEEAVELLQHVDILHKAVLDFMAGHFPHLLPKEPVQEMRICRGAVGQAPPD